jgi:YidC/Oxa1 family membrane protein insertase
MLLDVLLLEGISVLQANSVMTLSMNLGLCHFMPMLFSGIWFWLSWISEGLLFALRKIHEFVPNWGWTIILLALLVRICLYPLTTLAQKKQQHFVDLQNQMESEMNEIKKNFKGGDRSEKILQLYKKHNVSPMDSLKPLGVVFLQLPILLALFQVLSTANELRYAKFLWIQTLAEPDKLFSFGITIPYFGAYLNFLPFLMSFFTLLSFWLAPSSSSNSKGMTSKYFMWILVSLFFLVLFYNFPAGLVIYWTCTNIFHLIQTIIVKNRIRIHEVIVR